MGSSTSRQVEFKLLAAAQRHAASLLLALALGRVLSGGLGTKVPLMCDAAS